MTAQSLIEKPPQVCLSQLKPGDQGTITSYRERTDVSHRLRELGLVRGVQVQVKRLAPLGDPMELVVRGYHLSIRKKDAAQILVTRC